MIYSVHAISHYNESRLIRFAQITKILQSTPQKILIDDWLILTTENVVCYDQYIYPPFHQVHSMLSHQGQGRRILEM